LFDVKQIEGGRERIDSFSPAFFIRVFSVKAKSDLTLYNMLRGKLIVEAD